MNQQKVDALKNLSNIELGRLLLRHLWRKYDTGGISHGRSWESKILEEAMHLILPPDLDSDQFSLEDLLEEADTRRFSAVNRAP